MELQAPAGTREWQKERERYPFTWSQQQEWQECRQGAARRTSSPRRRLKSGHTIFMLISTVIGFFICTGLQALYSLLVFLLIHKSHAYQIKKINCSNFNVLFCTSTMWSHCKKWTRLPGYTVYKNCMKTAPNLSHDPDMIWIKMIFFLSWFGPNNAYWLKHFFHSMEH